MPDVLTTTATGALAPLLTPRGHLHLAQDPELPPLPAALHQRLLAAFAVGAGHGPTTARQLYDAMREIYPDRVNPGSLWGAANTAKKQVPFTYWPCTTPTSRATMRSC